MMIPKYLNCDLRNIRRLCVRAAALQETRSHPLHPSTKETFINDVRQEAQNLVAGMVFAVHIDHSIKQKVFFS